MEAKLDIVKEDLDRLNQEMETQKAENKQLKETIEKLEKERKFINLLYHMEISQKTLPMFVGAVALRYQHHTTVVLITKCHNSHKRSQSLLTHFHVI